MQVGLWIVWMVVITAWWHTLAAQVPVFTQISNRPSSFPVAEYNGSESSTVLLPSSFGSQDFLTLSTDDRFSYINPMSSEVEKNLYSQNIPLVLFATASRGEFESLFTKKTITPSPYKAKPLYVPTSSTRWYVGDRLFAVDNSAFFGIEFDSSFAYRGGVVRIGDSSEKAVVILVSLYPSQK